MATNNYFGAALARSATNTNSFRGKTDSDALVGTAGADKLIGGGAGHVLTGLGGDDTYMVSSIDDVIVEKAGGGIDTAVMAGPRMYTLANNVENMLLTGNASGVGNSLANIIEGSANNQTLDGGGGDDVLSGGGGKDVFAFRSGSGHDVITDFTGADIIRLSGYGFTSWSQVKSALTQDGSDVILRLSANDAVRLLDTKVADLTASQFQFQIDTSKMHMTFGDDFNSLNVFDAATQQGVWSMNTKAPNGDQAYINPENAVGQALGLNPFSVNNGILTITATPLTDDQKAIVGDVDYASGFLTTKQTFAQQYGYFEMRAETPQGQGAWPAFWLLPSEAGNTLDRELDVMEQVAAGYSHQAAHYAVDNAKTATGNNTYMSDLSGFHTYGMLWTATELAWYIDGVEVFSMATPPDLNKPMYLIANLAMGGAWAGDGDLSLGAQSFNIDYIRAYSVAANATSDTISGLGASTTVASAIHTGDGSDNALKAGSGPSQLKGLDGNDTLMAGPGNDTLDGGIGNDTANFSNAKSGVTVSLAVSGAQNTGGAGMEKLVSIENLIGTKFADTLTGDGGANVLSGGAGNDSLSGGAGDDTLTGMSGDDFLTGGAGTDTIDGGAGTDTVSYGAATAGVSVNLSVATAQNTGGAGIDTLVKIENLIGSNYGDNLVGTAAKNVIDGGAGDDVINGGGGGDIIIGGAGADRLVGGTGGGSDTFVYKAVTESTFERPDTITDFVHNRDAIDLSAIDANVLAAGQQRFTFIGGAAFSNHAGELRAVADSQGFHVYADVNGDGASDLHIVLTGKLKTLTASDFII